MATVNFYLNRAFKKGTDPETIKQMRKTGELKPSLLNPQDTTINLVVKIKDKQIKISSNERVLPKHWDLKNKKAKQSYPGSFELNLVLDRLKTNVITALRHHATVSMSKMTLEEVKELIR